MNWTDVVVVARRQARFSGARTCLSRRNMPLSRYLFPVDERPS
jgi:hypothetical protein